MPSGYQFGQVCYPTPLAAAQAYVSTLPPVVVSPQATCPHWANYVAGGSVEAPYILVTYTKIPTASCTVIPVATWNYLAPPCSTQDPFNLTLEEGSLIAGAVAAAWVTAWCFKAIFRALNTDGSTEKELS